MNFIVLLLFSISYSFKTSFMKQIRSQKLQLSNNYVKIIDFNFTDLVEKYDDYAIQHLNNTITLSPNRPEDIIEDSFEGYLKNHFNDISKNHTFIDFNTFYKWRKNKIGTLLYDNEIQDIYNSIVKNDKCDIMNFIKINNLIDETDGADF